MITELLHRVEAGEAISRICKDEHMPDRTTVWGWLHSDAELFQQWRVARERSAHALIDDAQAIADDDNSDVLYDGSRPIPNQASVRRSHLRAEQRKWLAGKLNAEYRDRSQIEVTGTIEVELGQRLDAAQRRLSQVIDVTPAAQDVSEPAAALSSTPDPK
jgi:hypothetical protein